MDNGGGDKSYEDDRRRIQVSTGILNPRSTEFSGSKDIRTTLVFPQLRRGGGRG